ncbi:phage holin family protein [Nocardioides sp. Root151]|uniref:phage holin family protein n=1 Tax=Nocardioides sp. Root151 TaxID=1736475 RepID=UPI000703BA2C|nr:phage holin family protein [Nocardioides sp. Root151]KQZ70698.1 hypothetical protein ASD66_14065 [Nocardioides sp. Root151]
MTDPDPAATPSTAELLRQLSDDTRRLVRDEIGLAKAEMTGKARSAGIGAGLFGAAGILGLFGLGTLITTAILALALAMDAWLAALVVTLVLFAATGVAAIVGKKQVAEGTPPTPDKAVASVKQDINELKGAGHGN